MARILLAQSIGSKSVALVASALLHGALAFAAARGAHGHVKGGLLEPVEIEVESLPAVALHPPADDDDDHDHAHAVGMPAHHTHPYPVAPDHDAHPHDPRIDHRLSAAPPAPAAGPSTAAGEEAAQPAAAGPLVADDTAPARFAMTVGSNTGAGVVVGGVGQGTGGLGGSETASAVATEASDEIVPESRVSVPARPFVKVKPSYPASAQVAGAEADVPLEIVVGTDGRVLEARVLSPAGFGFDEAARRAALASRFTPAEHDGRRVRVRMRWTMQFHFEK